MPYDFYQVVRFVALVGFVILAAQESKTGSQTAMIIYISLALLFQPVFKIAFSKEVWNVIDVLVAVGLIVSIFIRPKDKSE